jgi:hypothetical protein
MRSLPAGSGAGLSTTIIVEESGDIEPRGSGDGDKNLVVIFRHEFLTDEPESEPEADLGLGHP